MKVNFDGIKNIIFDLGGVILDLDFDASANAFNQLTKNGKQPEPGTYFSNPIFSQFQIGQLTPRQFRDNVRELLFHPEIQDQQIDDAWCVMLAGIPSARVEKIAKLRQNYKVFLFSNTNGIHIQFLEKWFESEFGFSFNSVFDGVAYSHLIFDSKPAVSSFQKVIEKFEIKPQQTLFIDDIEENVIGAEKAGLKSFWLRPGLDITGIL